MDEPDEIKRTAGAQRALGLAQLVNKVFAAERVRSTKHKHRGYCLEMTAPEAHSTADAKRSIQYLKLVPVDSSGGSTIVIATADPTLSHAELRSYEYLEAAHPSLSVERREYDALLEKVRQFFRGQDIDTKMTMAVDAEARARKGSLAPTGPNKKVIGILVGVAALLLVALAVAALGR